MILVSHRGNINGPNMVLENTPSYIQGAIDLKYDVEIDVRRIGSDLFLGHDVPEHAISLDWLMERHNRLWVHAKNSCALNFLIDHDIRVFYHSIENHVIIGNTRIIWSHNLSEASDKSIIPLLSDREIGVESVNLGVYGICSDYLNIVEKVIAEKR